MRTTLKLAAMLLLAVAVLPAAALAQTNGTVPAPAERPTFEEGYRLTFRNPSIGEWDYVYRGERDGLLVFENVQKGKVFEWLLTHDLNLVKSVGRGKAYRNLPEVENDPHTGMLNFPLAVGKKWNQAYTNAIGNTVVQRTLWAEVVSYEQITVPAGTFWAYKIEAVNQRRDRPQPAHETYWYAPETRYVVKYYSAEFQWEFELVKYGK